MLAHIIRSLSLILLGGLLTWAALNWREASPPVADEDDRAPPRAVREQPAQNDAAGLVLSRDQQQGAGIVTATLAASRRFPELAASALVVDVQPLLDLRERALGLRAEREAARTAAQTAAFALERLSRLKRQEAASLRQFQEADAQAAAARGRLADAEARLGALRVEARQQWGEILGPAALGGNDPFLEKLADGREQLLLVTLPPEGGLAGSALSALHAGRGERSEAREARLISAAPRSDALLQGETFFYALPAESLRGGMRLSAWLPLPGAAETGVDAPREAVVWRSGQPWVYVQTGPERFERRALAHYRDLGAVWFVASGLAPGETVVAQGAQLLLSEEFRRQIPHGDED